VRGGTLRAVTVPDGTGEADGRPPDAATGDAVVRARDAGDAVGFGCVTRFGERVATED
jgi:hypothetical protein